MNRLIALVMLATLAAIVVQIAGGDAPGLGRRGCRSSRRGGDRARRAAHACRDAARLGARADPPGVQSDLARSDLPRPRRVLRGDRAPCSSCS